MNLLSKAQNQLKEINAKDIKLLLKNRYPNEYSKMLIDDNAIVKRKDYYASQLEYTKAERKFNTLVFPLEEKYEKQFRVFTDGAERFQEQAVVKDESLLKNFKNLEHAKVEEQTVNTHLDLSLFPFDMERDSFAQKQPIFFFPKQTFSEACPDCNGYKYVTCKDKECKGRHEWKCNKCNGSGEVACPRCNGSGKNRCSRCDGKGRTEKTEYRNGKPYTIREQCSRCAGNGEIPCSKCKCSGKVRCDKCGGDGIITCEHCYGDPHRRGMIDCPRCHTAGRIAQIKYLTTKISNHKSDLSTEIGSTTTVVKREAIHKHVSLKSQNELIYENINGSIKKLTDSISKTLLIKHEENSKLSEVNYPLLLKAYINYQVIPIVEIEYKHFLTNEIHKLIIIDFWDNPELVMPTNAEKVSLDIKSAFKYISNTFSKWFNTEAYKKKEDKRKEIKLMIYLIKADGVIAEEEKQFLSSKITSLANFTNSEKKEFFKLMNAKTLPKLTNKDVAFSSEETKLEVIKTLEKIANSDGDFDISEQMLIEEIKKL